MSHHQPEEMVTVVAQELAGEAMIDVLETGAHGITATIRGKENNRALRQLLNDAIALAEKDYPEPIDIPRPRAVAPRVIRKIGRAEDANTLAVKRVFRRVARGIRLYGDPKVAHLTTEALQEHLTHVLDETFGDLRVTVGDGTGEARRGFAVAVAQQFPAALLAASDKLGADGRYAKGLLDALARNDRSPARLAPAATVAGSGTVATGALLTTELAQHGINFNEIAPIVGIWTVVVTIVVGLLAWRYRSTIDSTAMPFLIESIADWVANVTLTPDTEVAQRQSLLTDLEDRLLPRVERADPRLAAALHRAGDLLHDQAYDRRTFDPGRLQGALDALLALMGQELVQLPLG